MDSNFLLRNCCCFRRSSPNNLNLRHHENLISLDSIHIGKVISICYVFLRWINDLISRWSVKLWCTLTKSLMSAIAGQEVVVLKNGTRACGSGGVVLSTPLLQSKSYFEVSGRKENNCVRWIAYIYDINICFRWKFSKKDTGVLEFVH